MQGENMNLMAALPLQSEGQWKRKEKEKDREKEEIRIPQWSYQETKEFISIRAELEKDFTQTKRNKTLWEIIAGKMKDKGFRRSADQCKCKWKNLVNRYKGKETSEPDNGRQCPFFEELDAIFKERERNMDRLLLESESGARPKQKVKKLKRLLGEKSSDDDSEDDEDEEDDSEEEKIVKRKKRRADKERQRVTADKYRAHSMQEVLEDFFQQQQKFEEQWREAVEMREQERRLREREWREAMEKLEAERVMKEQAWREREDQRRAREEARADRRDELFAALINKLIQEEGSHI
uniref:Myb-like domain-containing protein n=1 Tax=Araucaria cunninghamii TaxID=56994 RepID=A0A0D6QYY9_ARACU